MTQKELTQKRRWTGVTAFLAGLLICIVLFLVLRKMMHSALTIHVSTVSYQDVSNPVATNGDVEAMSEFEPHAPLPTVIDQIFVKVGQTVSPGQEVMRLDDTDARKSVAMAQATLDSAVAALKNLQNGGSQEELNTGKNNLSAAQVEEQQAATSLASLQALQAKGAASANEVAAAKQHLAEIQARVQVLRSQPVQRYGTSDLHNAQAQVAQAQAALIAAESALSGFDIHTPIAGTVYQLRYPRYASVPTTDSLLSIGDLSHLQVHAYFDEPEIGKLAVGQPVKIEWNARPNQAWHGTITRVPTTIQNYGTRNVGECLISVDDNHGDLLPNTHVTVTVTTLQRFHVLTVPREALHTDGNNNFVYTLVDNHLHKTMVQVGVVNLTNVEITGGLKEGDTVALNATTEADLSDGLEVKVLQ
jgi:HlyD family secretion protein